MNSLPFQFFQLYNAYTLLIMAMESNFREWQVHSSYPTFRLRGMRFDPAKSSSLIYVITVFRLDVTFFCLLWVLQFAPPCPCSARLAPPKGVLNMAQSCSGYFSLPHPHLPPHPRSARMMIMMMDEAVVKSQHRVMIMMMDKTVMVSLLQVCALAVIHFILFFGNLLTSLKVIRQKLKADGKLNFLKKYKFQNNSHPKTL